MQLVLLDHGLYRDLDDEFRLAYAGLWRSLVFAGTDM
jgi:aarF domain-containing kinase